MSMSKTATIVITINKLALYSVCANSTPMVFTTILLLHSTLTSQNDIHHYNLLVLLMPFLPMLYNTRAHTCWCLSGNIVSNKMLDTCISSTTATVTIHPGTPQCKNLQMQASRGTSSNHGSCTLLCEKKSLCYTWVHVLSPRALDSVYMQSIHFWGTKTSIYTS